MSTRRFYTGWDGREYENGDWEDRERIAAPAEDDWKCLCDNTAWAGEGFWPCLADGTSVEPTVNGPWDGKLIKCARCDRIMDSSTWDGQTVAVVSSVETQQEVQTS